MIEGCRAFAFGGWPSALTLEVQPFHLAALVRIGGNPAQGIETGVPKTDNLDVFEKPQPSPFFTLTSSFVTWFM